MLVKRLFVTLTVLFSLLFPNFSQARNVSIPDANLAAAIRQEIGNSITTDTLLNLKRLEARNRGIKDLTGLEHAHNLEHLDFSGEYIEGEGTVNSNTISDFSPIARLTNLRWLYLSDCSISNVSFLAKLTQLRYLSLTNNPISDVSPLAGLTQLRRLYLYNTSVSKISDLSGLTQLSGLGISGSSLLDLSPLSKLTQLTYLSLGNNSISDISPLKGLTQLTNLSLWNNSISDISPLTKLTQLQFLYFDNNDISDISALSGLKKLTVLGLFGNNISDMSPLVKLNLTGTEWDSTGLYIERNPLDYAAIYTHIPAMQRKGIEIRFDSRTPTTLTKRLGDAQETKPRTALATPLVVEVKDEKNIPFAGVPIKFTVTAGGGKVNPAKTESDTTGRAETTLTLGSKLVKNTVRVTAAKIRQPVTFTATATDNPPPTFRKPITFSIAENTTAVGTVKATDADAQDSVTGYAINSTAGEDSARFSITPKGVLRFKTAPDYERPTTASRSNAYIVLVSATSGTGKRERTGTQPFTITVTDVDEPPDRPAAPTVTPATPTSLIVSWAAPANMGPPMSYQVRYRIGNTSQFNNANYNGRETTFILKGLTRGTNYQVQVQAKNDEGASAWSPRGSGTPKASPPIDFPDTALRAKITETLGKRRNAVITAVDMLALTELYAPNANIRNLTGLQHAHNLRRLYLGGEYVEEEQRNSYDNAISDLSPIQGLTQLVRLDISGNDVSNLSPLAGLTALTTLQLYNNPISDVSPLTGLTQLMDLRLPNTRVTDVAPLVGLIRLTHLNLSNTRVSDVAPLAALTQLRSLQLHSTSLSNIDALSSLTQLTSLSIGSSGISDLSPLKRLTQLVDLALWNNAISDISPLKGLTQLTGLNLSNNEVSDLSPLSGLTQLAVLSLGYNAILDVSPLVALDLPGTERNSIGLYIDGNPLSYASINTHIPAMQAKGIEVKFDPRTPTTLLKISGIAQEGVINTVLPLPLAVEVLDEEDRAFAGVPVKFTVAAGRGRLDATTVKTDAVGRAATRLTLGQTVGTTTVRATATDISQPVQFTATAILRNAPVMIPDANLRMKIMETLRKPLDETPMAADMLKLTTLTANNADIRDLTGLQHAVNLTRLSLVNNRISNVAPLAGLTQLTTLDLRNNWISVVQPLIGLTQLKGTKDWNSLYLQGNPLSDTSIDTHIPTLQAAGVDVRFDSIATQQKPIVRLIYFLPRDRQPQPDINAKMDRLIKDVQRFYEKQMENHGLGRKTFEFETDAHGNAVVYHINGKFDDVYYHDESNIVWREINEQFDPSKNTIDLTALDVSTENIGIGSEEYTACGTGGGHSHGGGALIPASGGCFRFSTTAHELGHAFGLQHDFRNGAYIMSYGAPRDRISQCAAEWLEVHRAFNVSQTTANKSTAYGWDAIEMLPPSRAASPNAIRFRFKVDAFEGLRQAQLYTRTLSGIAKGSLELIDYKRLKDNSNKTVEFVTTYLGPENESVSLRVIDRHGNFTGSQAFNIDVSSLLPRSRIVPIPDANLAAAIREEIGDSITTHTLLHLTRLFALNGGITDLTGLEHAHNLRGLYLGGEFVVAAPGSKDVAETGLVNSNAVSDFTPLAALTNLRTLDLSECSLSDISFLAKMPQLTYLDLSNNPISNVSPLAGLTQLGVLHLSSTPISDISALSGLTQLSNLNISGTSVSDVSPLAALTQLAGLELWGNNISDISSLEGLTQLTNIRLGNNNISDISALSGLTQLTELELPNNDISDISPLEGLTQLTMLRLFGNDISDISPLEGLTQLTVLTLSNNAILDVSPLVGLNLTGTSWNSTGLSIRDNPLSYTSINTHIPAMQAKGIEVEFDDRTPTTLVKISGAEQQGVTNTALSLPFVVEVRDQRNDAFAGVAVTFTVTSGGGKLSTQTVKTDATGRAAARLTLGRTAGTTTVRVAAPEILRSVQFTATAVLLNAPVTVSDAALHAEIASVLDKPSSSNLTVSDMLKLTALTANNADIRELTGLEQASNLTTLSLNGNNLSNIAPLTGLSKLTTLSLNDNNISDVAPLAGLAQLQTLSLKNNNLADVTPLSGLTQLKTLSLDNNRLWNVSAFTRLTELQTLSLNNNDLSDIAPLTSLRRLKTLQLKGNLLSYPSLHTHIPAIQAQGATVTVDLRTPTTLVKVSGTHGVAGGALPVIVEVQDEKGRGFAGVPVTFTVTAGGGRLSASDVITDITGKARTTVTFGATPGRNTIRVTAVKIQQPTIFTITTIRANSPVTVPDVNLRAKIVETLNKPVGVQLTAGDMLALTELYAPNANIRNLIGIQHAYNLKKLFLGGEYVEKERRTFYDNAISDLSPIQGLTQLTELDLSGNDVSDLSPLVDLTQLTSLRLYNNPLSDISPIVGLTRLMHLELAKTDVSDLSPLARLTHLRSLHLFNMSLSDVSALSSLTHLTNLDLSGNEISDVSPLSGLTQLNYLYLGWNAISDISALSGLTQLTSLNLSSNEISDVSPLSGLTQLNYLYLDRNAISDISALSDLAQLKVLYLHRNAILDVSPLVGLDLPGTQWNSTGLYIERNPLSYASINTHIPAMQAKSIEVKFDSRAPARLVKISGAAQQGLVNTTLPLPFVVEVRDQQNQAFAAVPVTFTVATGGGKLSITTVTTDAAGRAAARLTLGRTAGTTTVRVAAPEVSQPVWFTATAILSSAPVTVSDAALHAEITSALGKSANSNLTVSDMLKLTTLTANSANIRELTGLEQASNLTTLSLNSNNLSDIAPLAGLAKLTTLSLNNNRISDLAPLAALAQLQTLSLEDNNLADVTLLSGLTALKTLSLDNNRLWNVSALTRLTELQTLSLNNNDLSDIAPLTSLRRLKTLQLKGNLLSYPSLHTHIPAIQAQGATVTVDLRTPTTLVKVSGTHGIAGRALPVIVEVQDEKGLGFAGVPVTFTVTAGGGHLSASDVITDITGRARVTLTLGTTPGRNTVRATAVEVRQPVIFTITAIRANSPVTIPDVNLRAKVAETLNKPVGVQLTAGDMLALTELYAPNANIRNLIGIQHAYNLKKLFLGGEYVEKERRTFYDNAISDLSPIQGLTQLTELDLSGNDVSDLSPLVDLTQLTSLRLYNNPLSDISPIVGLTRLRYLVLTNTDVSDLSPLTRLTQLRNLYLFNTPVSDVSALSSLTELTRLGLSGNVISDVSPLSGLTQLNYLYLGWNAISDISALSGLTQLTSLNLSSNKISDISALSGLTQLTELYLNRNNISDISALSDLTQLEILNLSRNAISDVSPLVALDLPGTEWNNTGLYIEDNPLSYASLNTHIPAMLAKGITVRYNVTLAKITGPWLWMIAPTERWQGGKRSINIDSLAAVSAGAVTETEVATNGATEGDTVGDYTWTLGKIAPRGGNNINDLLNTIGMAKGDINDHSSYALITLESATAQSGVTMRVGSDDAVKVWLNGEVVHNKPIDRAASDFQDDFTVDLEKGDNLLLVKISERGGTWSMFVGIEADVNAVYKRPPDAVVSADVNGDGIVNVQDLVLVSSSLGQTGQSSADVNGDGVVNIQDLVLVAGALGQGTAAAPTLHASDLEGLTAADIQQMLTQARQMALTDPTYLRGIAVLEQLLARLLPKETALLPNYPNPFNPETWIPYQLAKPAEVTLYIYAVNGALVQTLALGHQSAGKYQSRSRAAYWDGRNSLGETVASGIYFYTLTVGDFTATRKMLIRK